MYSIKEINGKHFSRDVMSLSGNRRLAFILFPNAGHMVIFQWIAPVAVTVKICV